MSSHVIQSVQPWSLAPPPLYCSYLMKEAPFKQNRSTLAPYWPCPEHITNSVPLLCPKSFPLKLTTCLWALYDASFGPRWLNSRKQVEPTDFTDSSGEMAPPKIHLTRSKLPFAYSKKKTTKASFMCCIYDQMMLVALMLLHLICPRHHNIKLSQYELRRGRGAGEVGVQISHHVQNKQ